MLDKVAQVLRNYKDDDSLEITESTTFEDLGLDSLDTAQLVMDIEEEFDVTIELDSPIKDVGTLIKVIENAK